MSRSETKVIRLGEAPTTLILSKCKLLIMDGTNAGKEFIIDRANIAIGSDPEADLVLNDETVSRRHAEIVKSKDGYVLRDLNSTNGTFVDSLRVKEIFVSPGATIRFGKSRVKFLPQEEKIEIYPSKKDKFDNIIGKSLELRKVYGMIEKVAPTNVSALIIGETGTGKELVAQAIHAHSKRSAKPFVVFDCSSVQPNLIESELFGHERGAFTGATTTRQGAFEVANGGTIFLDELGELGMDMQPKLLRALEQGEVKRVGSDHPRRVDVRLIAATNRNLKEEVKKGRFREDLYFRISVVQVTLPPLRKRLDDLEALVQHFIERNNKGGAERNKNVSSVSADALLALREYHWPGNVRELKNVIDRAVSFCEGAVLMPADLPEYLREKTTSSTSPRIRGDVPFKDAKELWLESFEKDYLIDLLKRNDFNISKAAKQAGIDRKSVQRLLKKYNLNVKDIG